MERLSLNAESREVGKKGLGAIRQRGFVPAILYGHGIKPKGLSLNAKEIGKVLKSHAGMNAVIELKIANEKTPQVVMVKDYQLNVLTHKIIHMDLLKINIKEKVKVNVPIQVTGKAVGVVNGGVLDLITREIEVECLPTNIPSAIEVDITPLEIGNSLHLSDLNLPSGVEVNKEVNLTIVSVVAPRAEEPAAAPAAEVAAGEVPVVAKEKEGEEGAKGAAKGAEAPKAEAGKQEKPKAEKSEKSK